MTSPALQRTWFGMSSKLIARKAVTMAAITIMVGLIFGWASPRMFPRGEQAGIGLGLAHGALMPIALPSLIIGKDVEIFAANNTGRSYKIAYIVGINLCGLLFFGSAFWKPAKKQEQTG
jgi:hypothetical protein